jgi:hypothetical protein
MAELNSLDHPSECRVLDISGVGVRLRSNTQPPIGEVICVGFHHHVLVVRVRNVQPRGDRFAVGAERVCSFPKSDFPGGQPTFQQLQTLLAEKGWNIQVNTEPEPQPQAQAEPAPEPQLQAEPQPQTEPDPQPELESQPEAEAQPEPEPQPQAEPTLAPQAEPVPQLRAQPQPEEEPAAVHPPPMPRPMPTPTPLPPPPLMTPTTRSLRPIVAIAATFVMLISAGILFLGFRSHGTAPRITAAPVSAAAPEPVTAPAPAAADPAPVSADPGPIPAPAVTPSPAPRAVTPSPAPSAVTPSAAGHHVKVTILEPAWITASADGKPLLDRGKMFAKDDVFEFDFARLSYLHLGNSSGVRVVMDAKAVSLPEPHAVVGILELTPSGSRLLPWSNGDPVAGSKP